MADPAGEPRVLNVNIGVMGHVDSGKTSLVAALSSTLSTAALDKHPQSRERGITLDLGFSAFSAPLPPHLAGLPFDALQITLVDCPGHASLIRTIAGGARIIDAVLLVVDITKGLQAQTAECLVVAEMAAQRLVVALNKVDLLPAEGRGRAVQKAKKRLAAVLATTRFAGAPMVATCARPSSGGGGGGGGGGDAAAGAGALDGIDDLKATLLEVAEPRDAAAAASPLLFAFDHCFSVKGQGTVVTGTVLQGRVEAGQTVELPALKQTRQVKSIQMFRRPARAASRGDRAALLVPGLDAAALERGLAAAPGSMPTFKGAVAEVERVRFYAGPVPSRAKYHLIVGHDTLMAEATFFGTPDGSGGSQDDALARMVEALEAMSLHRPAAGGFSWGREYAWQDELYGLEGRPLAPSTLDQQQQQGGSGDGDGHDAEAHFGPQWALLKFEQPLTAPQDASVIGARLDLDAHGESCRLAFYGRLTALVDPGDARQLARLRVFKPKERTGTIERIAPDGASAICRGMFKKETDITPFVGAAVTTGRGEAGAIEGRFGASGKFRVAFPPPGLAPAGERGPGDNAVVLRYKKFLYSEKAAALIEQ